VPRCFGVDPRSHRGVHLSRRHGFSASSVYSHFELSRFDGPRFFHRGSCPTHSNGNVQETEPSTFSRSMYVIDRGLENKWLMDSGCS
jgi:hypothetical protein